MTTLMLRETNLVDAAPSPSSALTTPCHHCDPSNHAVRRPAFVVDIWLLHHARLCPTPVKLSTDYGLTIKLHVIRAGHGLDHQSF